MSKELDALVARFDYDNLQGRLAEIEELAAEIDSEQTWDLVYQVRCLLDAVETYIERHHAGMMRQTHTAIEQAAAVPQ